MPTLTAPTGAEFLAGGGETGKLIRSMDWSQSPLGPPEHWPQSLKTTISLVLASNFPLCFAWGPERVQFYNDGYVPLCADKHPRSLGQDYKECWRSAWPVIGPGFERCFDTGETSYFTDTGMFLDRKGYLEETFFTFSFSPIRDEAGRVAGIFHPVTETTHLVLAKRRLGVLRNLADRTAEANTVAEALELSAAAMAEAPLDLPFTVLYRFTPEDGAALRVGSCGLAAGTPLNPASIAIDNPTAPTWPLADAARTGKPLRVPDLAARFGAFECGPYPEPPGEALVYPIIIAGHPAAFLVAGVSSRRALDDDYRGFFDMLAEAVTTAVANAHAVEEERKRAEALAEIDRAKTAFFSNVSHEFRTPLTLMLAPLEDALALGPAAFPPRTHENLSIAHRNSLRLLKLVNSLLDFSRLEAGRMEASYEPVDLGPLTGELASAFRSAVERAGLSLVVDCPSLPEPTYVDRDMWEKIVLNLLSNAFKHTFQGEIRVTLRRVGGQVVLEVRDTGTGIPADLLPKVFDRFFRVKDAKSRTHEGTGIGLALVQELVKLHAGTIHAQSRVDHGTAFTISIPAGHAHLPGDRVRAPKKLLGTSLGAAPYVEEAARWNPEAPGDDTALDHATLPPPAAASHTADPEHRGRIVLADDNADMLDYIHRLLAPSYDVEAVADGQAALDAIRRHTPDLVLTDVMMPRLDGFALIAAIREDAALRTLPVLVLSARAGEEAKVEGLSRGADDYLVKPFAARELLARVRTHLDLARLRRKWASELERANKELESFSYSVSHDLRAPIRHIDGFTRLLEEQESASLSPEGRRLLSRVREGAARMGQLIDDLLRLSRLGRASLQPTEVDTQALVREVWSELAGKEHSFARLEMGPLRPVVADRALIRHVWQNLLENALKYTRKSASPRIVVETIREDGRDWHRVADNGVGFDQRYADKLFLVFQRLHRAEDFPGTGVGLAIVKKVVDLHAGSLRARGTPDKGAVFEFTLGSTN